MMLFLHMLIKTLTFFQTNWAFCGKCPRPSHSDPLSHILASFGTSTRAQWPFQRRRNSSTSTRSKNGRRNRHMPWQRCKNYMVSYCTLPWSSVPDTHTLPIWKPCFQVSLTVLSCHIPHPAILLTTSNGGQNVSSAQPSPETSLAQYLLQTSMHSRTPAQVSVLASRSGTNGAPGAYFQAGSPMDEISDGPKLLDSSSSPFLSCHPVAATLTSKFMGTTRESSKDGGKDAVRISKQTLSFGISTPSSTLGNAPSTPGMYPAKTTQLTICPEESIHLLHISCPTYPSPQSYAPSSRTSTLSSPLQVLVNTSCHAPYPNPPADSQTASAPLSMLSLTVRGRNSSPVPPTSSQERRLWNTPLLTLSSEKRPCPAPYHKNLVPLPLPLRLHCPANQRLCLWRLLVPRNQCSSQVSDEDLKRIQDVMAHAWELDTHATYASGLLNFMVFCDQKNIPEKDRAPASQLLIMSFVSTLATAYSGSAISNYVYGVWAWHLLHSIPWKISKPELEALLKAAEKLTPLSSRRKKRCPYTIDFMLAIWNNMDLDLPLGASAFACLATCFFVTGRIGEFTVQRLDGFNPKLHVSRAQLSYDQN